MADDLKYGYKGAEPTQSFGNNTGVFDPNDINNLIADNKWTSFGQLELIETQTISSVSQVDFTSIQESTYNVHFMTMNNLVCSSDAGIQGRFSNDGGSTFESSNYQYAIQYEQTGGVTNGEIKSTSASVFTRLAAVGAVSNEVGNGYIYFYNLGDSSKYSFLTMQSSSVNSVSYFLTYFGSQVYAVAETINAIRIYPTAGTFSGTVSLYGIAES